jgi:iron-sulfur cluster assembly protein
MITITEAAAEQIRVAAAQSGAAKPILRIAAKRMPDGGIDHTMGFDEASAKDTSIDAGDIQVVVSPDSKTLVEGLTLDYVELTPGDFRFIFSNPNDRQPPPPSA